MPVYNVMEEMVQNVLDKFKDQLHLACDCERCLDDVKALSLNHLPPKYVSNEKRSPFVRVEYTADYQGVANILSAVTQAAEVVSKNKRCNN
ncbi:late competence development ComFB family protein [Heyndrickxia acidicola]|uniref:Late competence development ComFB family protein n=1 Tax=Heyndrickxia acidicola TaxID=209389 RepID=A0ABU6MI79_9BACI|nr:late competence development ComFB family protein [Heyndrickxia acidicola]MED1204386.1 late competence development ComFB family protein [Heyndrickxia acidicola]